MEEGVSWNPMHLIAVICHEANRAWCEANGDYSQKSWKEAEEWQRSSAIKGVEFAIANPNAPDSAQHDAWSDEKKRDGWVFGEVKDAGLKTHPCLVPFEQLPEVQQKKDALFRSIVKALTPQYLQTKPSTTGLNFSQAHGHLIAGKKMAREGWNGKGMFALAISPIHMIGSEFIQIRVSEKLPFKPFFAIKGADGILATWVPSVTDLTAEDWQIAE